MKGTLLSLISFILLVVLSCLSLRVYRGKKYFYIFLIEFLFACLFYSLLFCYLPEDLHFLPPWLREPSRSVDFGNGLLILLLLFHMMWDAAYAFILTGFTSELFVRLFQKNRQGLSLEELVKGFGGDEEIDEILAWRLPNLLNCKYISAEGNQFRLLNRGRRVARFGLFLKKVFNMDVEG